MSFGGTTAEFRWYPSLLRKTLCLILLIGKICEWNDNPIHLNVLWMFDFYVELGSINSFRKLVHFCRLILASHDKINLEWEQLYWLQVHCMCTFLKVLTTVLHQIITIMIFSFKLRCKTRPLAPSVSQSFFSAIKDFVMFKKDKVEMFQKSQKNETGKHVWIWSSFPACFCHSYILKGKNHGSVRDTNSWHKRIFSPFS